MEESHTLTFKKTQEQSFSTVKPQSFTTSSENSNCNSLTEENGKRLNRVTCCTEPCGYITSLGRELDGF